jgi:hypothetical protein
MLAQGVLGPELPIHQRGDIIAGEPAVSFCTKIEPVGGADGNQLFFVLIVSVHSVKVLFLVIGAAELDFLNISVWDCDTKKPHVLPYRHDDDDGTDGNER